MNANEKLNSLSDNSIWYFTKQQTGFKEVFLAAKIFSEIPNIQDVNIESYFNDNFIRYGLGTDQHRILASSQMFGLITRTPYYSRSSSYNDETTTPIFEIIKDYKINSKEFNTLMSEQLIKIKLRAITDSESIREDCNVSPLLFLFLVMWKLKERHNIEKVDLDKIYTYVWTCKSMSEVDDAVEWLANPNARITSYLRQYKSDCRVRNLIFENIKLFSLVDDQVSLNHPIAEKFYQEFVSTDKCERLLSILNSNSDSAYKQLLNNPQNYNFDLTDNPTGMVERRRRFRDIRINIPEEESAEGRELMDDIYDYIDDAESNESTEYSDENDINASNNRQPVLRPGSETNHRYTTDPKLAKTAIKQANYKCALTDKIPGHTHNTFESNNSRGHEYLEAHHLVPMKAQKDYVSAGINLDRLENIVALCPNCHKAVHYGTYAEKVRYLKPLYDERIESLRKAGIDISFKVLMDEYY